MNRVWQFLRPPYWYRNIGEWSLRGGLCGIQVNFVASDCWMGFHIDRDQPDLTIFICPLPTLEIRLVLVPPSVARDRKRRSNALIASMKKQQAEWMPAYVAQLVKQNIDDPLPRRRFITGISGFDAVLPGDFKSKVPGDLSNVVVVKKNES